MLLRNCQWPLDRAEGLVNPASTPIRVDRAIQRLHNSLGEVNAEMGILLHENIKHIATKNDELLILNMEVEAYMACLRRGNFKLIEKLDKMENLAT